MGVVRGGGGGSCRAAEVEAPDALSGGGSGVAAARRGGLRRGGRGSLGRLTLRVVVAQLLRVLGGELELPGAAVDNKAFR